MSQKTQGKKKSYYVKAITVHIHIPPRNRARWPAQQVGKHLQRPVKPSEM